MLDIKSFLRAVVAICSAIVGLAISSNSLSTMAIESFPGNVDLGLGLSIEQNHLELPQINMPEQLSMERQRVIVGTSFGVSYRLSLMLLEQETTTGGVKGMVGSTTNHVIGMPLIDKTELSDDSWGLRMLHAADTGEVGPWLGLPACGSRTLAKNRDVLTDETDEFEIEFGVKSGASTPADVYQARMLYTLTPLEPTRPAVLAVSRSNYPIGDRDNQLALTGVRLNELKAVAIDFNNDGEIGGTEQCVYDGDQANDNYLTCNLPQFDQTLANDEMGGRFAILLSNDSQTWFSGYYLNYYYKIGAIDMASDHSLTIKDSVGVVDMATSGTSTLVLTDDGDVYQMGGVPVFDNTQQIFDQTYQAAIVDFPDAAIVDYPIDLATDGQSYFAMTVGGQLYGWGDNSNQRLAVDTESDQILKPTASSIFRGSLGGMKLKVVAGDGFYAVLDKDKQPSKANVSMWGTNLSGRLGRDVDPSAEWMSPVQIIDNEKYKLGEDELYVDIEIGKNHAVGVTNYGRVFTWGEYGDKPGGDGRLGFRTEADARRPHDVTNRSGDKHNFLEDVYDSGNRYFVDVAAGDDFTIALTNNGEVYTFGNNDNGQLGIGSLTDNNGRAFAITDNFHLANDDQIVGVAAHGLAAAAWSRQGRLYVWGKLGGEPVALAMPRQILLNWRIKKVVLGDSNNYAITMDGKMLTWSISTVKDVTWQLTHPTTWLRLEGDNIGIADIWIDFNGDYKKDGAEAVLAKNCLNDQLCYVQVSTAGAVATGEYVVYADTKYQPSSQLVGNIVVQKSNRQRHPDRLVNSVQQFKHDFQLGSANEELDKESVDTVNNDKTYETTESDQSLDNSAGASDDDELSSADDGVGVSDSNQDDKSSYVSPHSYELSISDGGQLVVKMMDESLVNQVIDDLDVIGELGEVTSVVLTKDGQWLITLCDQQSCQNYKFNLVVDPDKGCLTVVVELADNLSGSFEQSCDSVVESVIDAAGSINVDSKLHGGVFINNGDGLVGKLL